MSPNSCHIRPRCWTFPLAENTINRGLAGWQWLFIIEGAASFLLGLIAIMLLPDFPHSTTGAGKWLFNEEERQLAIERIERDRVSDKESDHSIWYGLKLAAKDYRVWVFVSRCLMANCDVARDQH